MIYATKTWAAARLKPKTPELKILYHKEFRKIYFWGQKDKNYKTPSFSHRREDLLCAVDEGVQHHLNVH
jgi:hypothetical protein